MVVPLHRRRMLLGLGGLAGAALLPGCTSDPGPPGAAPPVATRPTTAPTTASTTGPTTAPTAGAPTPHPLPPAPAWRPSPRDSAPEAKVVAAEVVAAAGTWAPGEEGTAPQRLADHPVTPRALRALVRSGLDRGAAQAVTGAQVVQMGGLLPDRASVIVVARRWTTGRGSGQRTLDVRLRRAGTGWVATDVRPARPGAAMADPGGLAARVLASPTLVLPAAARADVAAGQVHDRLLTLLLALAQEHVLGVTVLRSGHPYRIFDKPQVSDHSVGRAADVWAVDGRPVVRDARRRVLAVMRRAVELGAYQVGGPWDPGPAAAPFYTDAVHQDHLHLGVPA